MILTIVFFVNTKFGVTGKSDFKQVFDATLKQKPGDFLVRKEWFEQRGWIKAKLSSHEQCPDVLILASSTLGHFGYPLAKNYSVLNLWMGTPNPEDFEAITQMLEDIHCVPGYIVFGADAIYFNEKMATPNWKALDSEYSR